MEKININWYGSTTDGAKKFSATAGSYKELFEAINNKYGYGYIFSDNCYEIAILKANDEYKYKFGDEEDFNYSEFEEWYNEKHRRDLTEDEYKEMMESNKGMAYYQTFEEEDL